MNVDQQKILSVAPVIPSLLSIFGSTIILRCVYVTPADKRGSYERILFGLSIMDILATLSLLVTSFVAPRDGGWVWSIGNDTSCTWAGAIFQLGAFGGALYNASLSVYYLVTIRYGVKGRQWMKQFGEAMMHAISIGYPLATVIAGVVGDAFRFGPMLGICWVSCPMNEPCNDRLFKYLFAAPVPISWCIMAVAMTGIWVHVRTTTERHDKRSSTRKIRVDATGTSARNSASDDVASQAILYVSTFTAVSVGPITLSLLSTNMSWRMAHMHQLFPWMLACVVVLPVAGFGNLLVFLRPKFVAERRATEDGRWACCVRVLKGHWEHGTQSKTSAKSSKASSTTRMTSVASSRWNSTSEPQSSRDSMKTTGEPQQPSRDTMQPSTDSMEPTVAPQPSDDVMDGMLMR